MSMNERLRTYLDTVEVTYPLTAIENDVIAEGGLRCLKTSSKTFEYGFDLFGDVVVREVFYMSSGTPILRKKNCFTNDLDPVRFSEVGDIYG